MLLGCQRIEPFAWEFQSKLEGGNRVAEKCDDVLFPIIKPGSL